MSLRGRIKRAIPISALNLTLLTFPDLYRLRFVHYESNVWENGGMADIQRLLDTTSQCPGDVVECGASRCGTSVLMARQLRNLGVPKKVYALDTYEGFPSDDLARERARGWTDVADDAHTSTSLDYVTEKVRRLGFAESVIPVRGLFNQTLPTIVRQKRLSFAFVDCDLKESTSFCIRTVWPSLNSSGILAFDDYLGPLHTGVKLAVDEFVSSFQNDINDHGMLQRLYFVQKR